MSFAIYIHEEVRCLPALIVGMFARIIRTRTPTTLSCVRCWHRRLKEVVEADEDGLDPDLIFIFAQGGLKSWRQGRYLVTRIETNQRQAPAVPSPLGAE